MATTVDAGYKDLTWADKDGGATTPTATGNTVTGAIIDLKDGTSNLLPMEVALKVGIDVAGTAIGAIPKANVYALWQEGTGDAVDADDKESQLIMASSHTTTAAWGIKPSNVRVVPTKSRYLKLRYKKTAGNGTWSWGCSHASMFNQGYK